VPQQRSAKKTAPTTSASADLVNDLELETALGFLFRRLNSLSNLIFLKESKQTELTAMQAGILLTVYREEIIGLRELARRMYVDRSTIQEVVNRLVSRELIARRVPEHDKRTYELSVTPKGRTLLLKHVKSMAVLQERLLTGIDPKRAAIAQEVLQEILKNHDC
jgi:DNA-binding MarR family transcriptional regulator